MSWFNTSGFSNLAKSAISQAQKSIDKVLDIKDEDTTERKQPKRSDKLSALPKSSSYSESLVTKSKSSNESLPDLNVERKSKKYETNSKDQTSEKTQEDDPFFASFLGGSKQSTPKANKTPSVKLKSLQTTKDNETKTSDSVNISDQFVDDSKTNGNTPNSKEAIKNEDNLAVISIKSKDTLCDVNNKKHENSRDSDATEGLQMLTYTKEDQNSNEKENTTDRADDSKTELNKPQEPSTEPNLKTSDSDIDVSDDLKQDLSTTFNLEESGVVKSDLSQNSLNLDKDFDNTADDGEENDSIDGSNSVIEASSEQEIEKSDGPDNESRNDIIDPECSTLKEQGINIADSVLEQNDDFGTGNTVSTEETENSNVSSIAFATDETDSIKSITGGQDDKLTVLDDLDVNKPAAPDIEREEQYDNLLTNSGIQMKENQNTKPLSLISASCNSAESNEVSKKQAEEAENLLRQDIATKQDLSEPDCIETKEIEGDHDSKLGSYDGKEDQPKSDSNEETAYLQQEVKRLKELVEARESKMVTLSKENIDLQETVSILKNQLEQAEQATQVDDSMILEMRDEFSKRIGELNTKLNKTTKERNEFQKELEEKTERLTKEQEQLIHDFRAALEEKEEQIAGLLAEGEALSKRELKSNNAVKKLKLKAKELEKKADAFEKENEDKEKELKSLKETLSDKLEQEKTLQDQLKKLEIITDQQEDEISKLKDQLDDAEDKMKGMQTTLDSGYLEINRLSVEKANRESEIEEITLLKSSKEELEKKIIEIENEANLEKQENQNQMASLRLIITRTEQAAARREDHLQLEIKDLHQRIEEAELRNQELSQSIATASRPLLRQIENLQSSHHNQAANWEKIEKSFSERLASAQNQLAIVSEKERSAVEFAMEIKSRVNALEMQVKTLRQEKAKLSDDLQEKIEDSKNIEENLNREKKKYEDFSNNFRKTLEELQNEKMYIENQLNAERAKHETELSRMSTEYRANRQLSRQNSSNAVSLHQTNNKHGERNTQEDDLEHETLAKTTRSRTSSSSSSSNVIETTNRGASTAIMEKLQTQLRQKDGELQLLKEEITALQKTRASLAQELVDLANLVEDLQDKLNDSNEMKENYKALESRYNAALQMYGEKAEEADELRMDLEDIKQMYKQQIQQLIGER
ncbi:TATA element modulatory factor-like [Rhopilema esculentum]|uniref:TATA element modulatory factor-like n=1 Tax=Rhopilema esculentum TaxID=499914 RepID=UPI0031DEF447